MKPNKKHLRKKQFQSTLPRRERHGRYWCCERDCNFNPRSREGSDLSTPLSISPSFDFNPRSREGSDHRVAFIKLTFTYFNPRSREGSDAVSIPVFYFRITISIHAPAKGATGSTPTKLIATYDFNPRSREGSDKYAKKITFHFQRFQSTLPRRERQTPDYKFEDMQVFQSTLPRRERRCTRRLVKFFSGISIHAPAKGATIHFDFLNSIIKNFNPRSREGSDEEHVEEHDGCLLFQSTLPRRERLKVDELSIVVTDFNPRSREGSDLG